MTPISKAGRTYFSIEQLEQFSPKYNLGRGGKVWIPKARDGLSPLEFARKTKLVRKVQSLKAAPKKV